MRMQEAVGGTPRRADQPVWLDVWPARVDLRWRQRLYRQTLALLHRHLRPRALPGGARGFTQIRSPGRPSLLRVFVEEKVAVLLDHRLRLLRRRLERFVELRVPPLGVHHAD